MNGNEVPQVCTWVLDVKQGRRSSTQKLFYPYFTSAAWQDKQVAQIQRDANPFYTTQMMVCDVFVTYWRLRGGEIRVTLLREQMPPPFLPPLPEYLHRKNKKAAITLTVFRKLTGIRGLK